MSDTYEPPHGLPLGAEIDTPQGRARVVQLTSASAACACCVFVGDKHGACCAVSADAPHLARAAIVRVEDIPRLALKGLLA